MRFLPCGLFLLLLSACGRERVRDYEGIVPGTERGRVALFLVRDARTGRPVAGATVRQHLEWAMGRDGRWAPAVTEAKTDEFGLVAFPLDEDTGDCHWAVHASGYAPTEEYGEDIEDEIELVPGTRRTGRLLGIDGRPLAGARLEWKVGCAHSPALARARTGKDGVFVFDGVGDDGDALLVGGEGASDYLDTAPATVPWGPPVQQLLPARTVKGRVLRADGTPPPWAVVTTFPRGPTATAGPDGAFVLPGVGGSGLQIWWDGGRIEVLDDYAPGLPVVLRLGPEAEPETVPIRIRVRGPDGAPPEESVEVHFDRLADGRRFTAEWSGWGEGVVEAWLPPGAYVVAAGQPWSPHFRDPEPLRITDQMDLAIDVRPRPMLAVLPPNIGASYEATWRVVLESDSWEFDPDDDEPVHLPAAARAWLRVDLDGVPYTYPVGPERSGVRSVEVRLPGVKFIPVPGIDEGAEAELRSARSRVVGSGLATFAVGEHWLAIAHPDRGWALVRLELPFEAAEIDPGDVVLTPWPLAELRVYDQDGRPAAGVAVEAVDLHADPTAPRFGEEQAATDEAGIFRAPWLRDGVHVRVRAPGCVPVWKRLTGDPPYEAWLGTATVVIDLGEYQDGAVLLDGWTAGADDRGLISLVGVTAGTHMLLVGAAGRGSLVYDLVLREGETRRLRPRLPRR